MHIRFFIAGSFGFGKDIYFGKNMDLFVKNSAAK